MANKRFIDFPIATTVGDNDIILIWQSGANKQTTKATILSGVPDSLNDLTDVTISGLTNGQILRYDSVSGQWENTDQGNLDLNDLNDVTIVSPTNGQVLVYNSTTSKWENSSGGYVPYVGAVTTVNLGAQSIQAGSFVKQSGTASQFLKADGSVDSTAYGTGSVTSVGLTMPAAFNVANSPITTAGTLAVTGAGTVAQYIRGDGSLADFPESSGGGSSVSYYLNGSVAQGTIGGVAYKELNKVPILGAGTDFTINADGYIASFITDAGDPNLLEIPGGNWNFETYFSASSSGGTPTFYVELYKYDGTTFTLIASSVTSPEFIAFGTTLTPYFSTLAVPTTTLALTDRLAIRYYVTHSGRTITLHTENNHLCQIITTFTTGLTALNGLTAQVQNFAVGTTGTDFNIASAVSTHTFNLPTASATNRGALSSADWALFTQAYNDKINSAAVTGTTTKTLTLTQQDGGTITASWSDLNTDAVLSVFGRTGNVIAVSGDYTTAQVTESVNLYYTDGRARGSLSFAAGSGAYNTSTGVITIPTNNNQITNGAGYITSAALAGYLPLTGGTLTGPLGGTSISLSGNLQLGTLTGGTSTSTPNNINLNSTFSNTAGSNLKLILFDNTSSDIYGLGVSSFQMDFSVPTGARYRFYNGTFTINNLAGSGTRMVVADANGLLSTQTIPLGTVTSVTASSPLASSGGTTPNITIQQASGSQNGFLSSTDWTTFNSKVSSQWITSGSNIYYNTGNVLIGTISDNGARLQVSGAATFSSSVTATNNVTILSTSNSSLVAATNSTTGFSFIDLINNGASGRNYQIGIGGNSAATGYANNLYFDLVGVANIMTLTSGRNVLIGTQFDNGARLQVSGSGLVVIDASRSANEDSVIQITNTNSGSSSSAQFFANNGTTKTQFYHTGTNYGTLGVLEANQGGIFNLTSAGIALVAAGASGILRFATGGTTTRLTISSTGAATFSSSVTANGTATFLAQFGNGNNVNEKVIQFLRASASTDIVNIQGINAGVGASAIALQALGGNVGIGTPNPTEILHLNKTSGTGTFIRFQDTGGGGVYIGGRSEAMELYAGNSERMRIASGGTVTINNLAGSGNRIVVANSGGTLISAVIGSGLAFDGTTLTATGGGSGSISGSGTSGTIALFTGATSIGNSAITQSSGNVLFSGNVGIGPSISFPDGDSFLIQNSGVWNVTLGLNNTGTGGRKWNIFSTNTTFSQGAGKLLFYNSTAGSNAMVIDSSNNVGIGTTSPNFTTTNRTTVDINGTSSSLLALSVGGASKSYLFQNGNDLFINNTTGLIAFNAETSNIISFATANTPRMTITSGGNVLIGSIGGGTSTASPVNVNLGSTFSTTAGSNLKLTLFNDTGGAIYGLGVSNNRMDFNVPSGAAYSFYTGNVLINTTSDNGNRLRVNGTIWSDSSITATSFFESSDATLKTLVEENYQAQGIESVVAKLYIKNGKEEIGYFAQDLQTVLPSAVSKGSDGLLNLSYREVHTAKIAYLEEEIRQLKKRYEIN